jgi:hypothetical protein
MNDELLTKKANEIDICRVIYDLIHGCIKGKIKKEALFADITELSVR